MIGLVRHLLDVGAGGERLVGAGEQDAADAGVGIEAVDARPELLEQGGIERIERLRPVEPDHPDARRAYRRSIVS